MYIFCIGFMFGVIFSLIVFGAGVLYEDYKRKHTQYNRDNCHSDFNYWQYNGMD